MSPTRRDFLKTTAATAASLAVHDGLVDPLAVSTQTLAAPDADPLAIELANAALDAARSAGASYADVRVGRYRRQSVATRERQVTGRQRQRVVRARASECWWMAAGALPPPSQMTRRGAQQAALEAVVLSKAARAVRRRRVELAPVTPVRGTWITPVRKDPIEVSIEEKIALLLAANEAALKVKGVQFVNSGVQALREIKTLVTSEGTNVTQTLHPGRPVVLGHRGRQRRLPVVLPRRWRRVARAGTTSSRWTCPATPNAGRRWRWRSWRPGASRPATYDLILEPSNLWLTIHESIGHATELDRAIGEEANYAGTSFVAPPEKVIGQLKYGPPLMNIQADRTQPGSLSRVAWDDEGVPADQWLLVERGIFKDYQTTREQVARIQKLTGVTRSHGCSFADSWRHGAVPAHAERVAAARRAGHLARRHHLRHRSRHRDQARRLVVDRPSALQLPVLRAGVLRGARRQDRGHAARRRLPERLRPYFWNSMDMIGGKSSYWMGGAFNDGKGEPSQINSVSHGCVPARFRQRTHPEHREDVVSAAPQGGRGARPAPGAVAAGTTLLSREQARALADRVLKMSAADHTRRHHRAREAATPDSRTPASARLAKWPRPSVVVTATVGRRRASATTNVLDDASLQRTVDLAASSGAPGAGGSGADAGARAANLLRACPALRRTHRGPRSRGARHGGAARGRGRETAGRPAGQIFSAGFLEAQRLVSWPSATSAGLFAYHRTTDARFSVTARTPDGTGSGWASAGARDWSTVDAAAVGRIAAQKAVASRNPQAIEPGHYTAVLEPQAVTDLVPLLGGRAQRAHGRRRPQPVLEAGRRHAHRREGDGRARDALLGSSRPAAARPAVRQRGPAAAPHGVDREGRAAQSGLHAVLGAEAGEAAHRRTRSPAGWR